MSKRVKIFAIASILAIFAFAAYETDVVNKPSSLVDTDKIQRGTSR